MVFLGRTVCQSLFCSSPLPFFHKRRACSLHCTLRRRRRPPRQAPLSLTLALAMLQGAGRAPAPPCSRSNDSIGNFNGEFDKDPRLSTHPPHKAQQLLSTSSSPLKLLARHAVLCHSLDIDTRLRTRSEGNSRSA